jgi:ubiquinol-cytochrome c reductase cytochrome b subunit
VHQPLGPVDEHGHGTLEYAGAPVPKKINTAAGVGRAIKGFFSPVEEPPAIEHERERERELAGRPKDPQI